MLSSTGRKRSLDVKPLAGQDGRAGICRQHFKKHHSQRVKKNELKPWQKKEWCIPKEENADFVSAMEDVLEIYKLPYDPKRPVVCLDESNKQLLYSLKFMIPFLLSQDILNVMTRNMNATESVIFS